MRVFLCNCSAALSPSPTSTPTSKSPFLCNINNSNGGFNWPQKTLLRALTGALSISLFISPPSSAALEPLSLRSLSASAASPSEYCRDDEGEERSRVAPEFLSNEGIVEEAWEVVNDSFLDAGSHRWSPEFWLQKKEDILSTSIQTRSKAHDIIRRMLAGLGDSYTRFLSPQEFSKMSKYDMTGIGINLREVADDNGGVKLKVLGLILDGRAHSAGVRQGDEILSVNGVDVKGKSAFEVSSLLQGPNETSVAIKVKHGKCGPIQSIEVQRQLTARTPVFYRLEQVENAMKRLQDLGVSYFILDLRDNLGGLVQAGIEIAKLFLNKGETVIYTVGRDPQYQKAIVAEATPLVTAPLIVLVNGRTASASEIVAGALHDNCRAVLVGERTFGKGLIQSVFELHDGSGMVVTVGKYVTPNHMDINGNGIEPDFENFPAWNEVAKHISQCNMLRQG
ncbi:carboxyl-terminal-processing peptidase 1, chloroplastic isoform X2 [Malania oleifera]|uniref:carboxyl-terminal-processing peptidase 1, chloroplastic isoform X2 n=1 Tax=Malania oleifera TaxID=397392 RepID=UPI0025AE7292|nr:carboxyl-terminal-processing peptidase 1, chloroplastic isoform X2 [Malania oleifera]